MFLRGGIVDLETGQWMGWQHGHYHGLGMNALVNGCLLVARTLSWFGHGCTGPWMGWQHGRYHGLGMDALANG